MTAYQRRAEGGPAAERAPGPVPDPGSRPPTAEHAAAGTPPEDAVAWAVGLTSAEREAGAVEQTRSTEAGRVAGVAHGDEQAPVAEVTRAADVPRAADVTRTADVPPAADAAHAAEQARAADAAHAAEEDRAVDQALALVAGQSSREPRFVAQSQPQVRASVQSPRQSAGETSGQSTEHGPGPSLSAGSSGVSPRQSSDCSPGHSDDRSPGHSLDRKPGNGTGHDSGRSSGLAPARDRRGQATAWREARALAARAGRGAAPRTQRLSLDRALGHVLAEPLAALTDLPSFDTSAMDGWVVAGPGPWALGRSEGGSGELGILAGHSAPAPLPDGEGVRIATGARIPANATAVIRSEHAHVDEAKGLLYAQRQVVPGQDIRPRGQECRSGDQLLPAGTLVTPGCPRAVRRCRIRRVGDGPPPARRRPRPRGRAAHRGSAARRADPGRSGPHDRTLAAGPGRRGLRPAPSRRRRGGSPARPHHLRRGPCHHHRGHCGGSGRPCPPGPAPRSVPGCWSTASPYAPATRCCWPGCLPVARISSGCPATRSPPSPVSSRSPSLSCAGWRGRAPEEPYRVVVRDEVHGHPHDTRLVPVVHRVGSAQRAGSPAGNEAGAGVEHVVPLHYNGPAMLRGIAAADGLAVVPPGGVRSGTEVEILDLPWASATPWTEGCFT